MTYYDQIGLSPSASPEAIDSALLDLGLDWRDRVRYARTPAERLEAERMLQAIDQIRYTLLDPARRAAYDQSHAPVPSPLLRRQGPSNEGLFRPTTIRVSMTPEAEAPQAQVPPLAAPVQAAPIRVEPVRPRRVEKERASGLRTALMLGGLAVFLGALVWSSGAFRSPVRDLEPVVVPPPVEAPAAPVAEDRPAVVPPQAAPQAPAAPAVAGYETFSDSRGGYTLAIPASLSERARTANGYRFSSPDGRAELLTESVAAPMSIPNAYRQATSASGRDVTYKASGSSWYVVSGYEGDRMFYEKTVWSDGKFKSFRMTVPREQRDTYYTPIERVSHSFKTN